MRRIYDWTTANPIKAIAVAGSVWLVSVLAGRPAAAVAAALATAYVAGSSGEGKR